MNSFAVVLDTAVLFPPSLRDILLICANNELFIPYWSDDILIELERNLYEENQMSQAQAKRITSLLKDNQIFGDALVARTSYSQLIPAMTNHPKDRHVLAAAVVAGAKMIVTLNIKDFPESSLTPYGIEVKTPDALLLELFETEPNLIITIISFLSLSRKNPPQTVRQVLDQLRVFMPDFVVAVEDRLTETGNQRRNS